MSRLKIILHFGPHKTGTSSIQSILFVNRENLSKHGIVYYPSSGCCFGGHHNLAWESQRENLFDAARGGWNELAAELFALGNSTSVVLSSEEFSRISISMMSHAFHVLKNHDVTVLYVYRPLASFFESLYAEEAKNGQTCLALRDFVAEKIRFDHRTRIGEHLRALIGLFNVNVRVIPYSYNVLPDVMSFLGVPKSATLTLRLNERLEQEKLRQILGHRRKYCALSWNTFFDQFVAPFLAGELLLESEPAPETDFVLPGNLIQMLAEYDAQNVRLFESHQKVQYG